MDELKLLIDMVKGLPNASMLILGGYLFYKLFVIGSVYSIIRLAINHVHSWLIKRKELAPEPPINQYYRIEQITIHGDIELLLTELRRLIGRTTNISTPYIHRGDVIWLRKAISAQIKREQEVKTNEQSNI